jgi:exodeoxyribonuclease V beta subunit
VQNRPDDGADKSKRAKDQRHPKTAIRPVIAQATAGRIAQLLTLAQQGQAYIAEGERRRPLTGGDIAVLVRTHYQAQDIGEALLAVGAPSVQHSEKSVFMTAEVVELERALQAIAAPRQEDRVRAALLTDLFGVSGDELYQLTQQEHAWENVLSEFHEYHELWRDQGFIQMFRALLSRRDSYRRLLGFRDGERRLTNMLHLAELAQAASLNERLGMTGLLKWLAEQRQDTIAKDETRQLRLESDADRVKIVTIHKSKGLQYPIVFCPFLWDGRIRSSESRIRDVFFHDPAADDRPTLVLGIDGSLDDPHRAQASAEELAESLRLLYVALTRAVQELVVVHARPLPPGLRLDRPAAHRASSPLVA